MPDRFSWVDADAIRVFLGGIAGGTVLALFERRDWLGVLRFATIGGLTAFYTAAALTPIIISFFKIELGPASGFAGFSAFVMGIGAPSLVELIIAAFRVRREKIEGSDDA